MRAWRRPARAADAGVGATVTLTAVREAGEWSAFGVRVSRRIFVCAITTRASRATDAAAIFGPLLLAWPDLLALYNIVLI